MLPKHPAHKPLFTDPLAPDRIKRAEALRRRALSPMRIMLMVLMLPMTTLAIATSVYLRTSEFEQEEAVFHLIALASCSAALSIIPGPYLAGKPGYHLRNDPDRDGVACGTLPKPEAVRTVAQSPSATTRPAVGSAKFLRP